MPDLQEIKDRWKLGCECDITRVLCTYCNEIGDDVEWLVAEVEAAETFMQAVAKRLGKPVSEWERLVGRTHRQGQEIKATPELQKGRIHLGLVNSDDYPHNEHWEMRVMPERGAGVIVRVKLTPEQFSGLMASQMVTDVELE